MTYLNTYLDTPIPQSEPLDERQVPNSAGGYSYPVTDETRLTRFLVLGAEGGSYYAEERKLVKENAEAVIRLIKADGLKAVELIVSMSKSRRAPKNSPALFALALAASYGDDPTRALALDNLPIVARTGSHLQEFVSYVEGMRRWGRGLRSAVANWYMNRPIQDTVYQVVKYRNRYGWTHRDLLRKSHPMVENAPFITEATIINGLFDWVTHGHVPAEDEFPSLELVRQFEAAKTADVPTLAGMIREHGMSWEMVPSEALEHKEIWQALGEDMPIGALVRNLATMTRAGAIAPMDAGWVCKRLNGIGNPKVEDYARIHPISVLSSLLTYRSGHGVRGSHSWTPVQPVVDALDYAFDRSFGEAPVTNKRLYLGIDVSGSMGNGQVAQVPGLTPRMAAAAMAMVIARRESNYHIAAFSDGPRMMPLDISARDSITDAMRKTDSLDWGRTDCALPMLDALEQNMPVDCFVVLTDSETWHGKVHPMEALRRYREGDGHSG